MMASVGLDHLELEYFSPLGGAPLLVVDAAGGAGPYRDANAIIVGVDRGGALPAITEDDFDVLLTSAPHAPRPWVSVAFAQLDSKIETLRRAVERTPFAAMALRQTLRINEALPPEQGLIVESFAYSTLLGGAEFRAWRASTPATLNASDDPPVTIARDEGHVTITLTQPRSRNAMSAAMRDALFEALTAVLDDPSAPRVTLRGDGACFSVGGDLAEFGANQDQAQAHAIRTMRSIAGLVLELGDRIDVVFHGACIGSGLEAPAGARRRVARPGAFFQLPELRMGLIPGAGGTVTLPRAIGRHRACAMMLSGARVSAATALEWGLVHAIEPAP